MLARTYIARPYDGPCLAIFHGRGDREEIWRTLLDDTVDFSIIETTHLGFFIDPALTVWQQTLAERLGASSQVR